MPETRHRPFSPARIAAITSNTLNTDEEIIANLAPTVSAELINYPENTFTHSAKLKTHSVRFGVNYRF